MVYWLAGATDCVGAGVRGTATDGAGVGGVGVAGVVGATGASGVAAFAGVGKGVTVAFDEPLEWRRRRRRELAFCSFAYFSGGRSSGFISSLLGTTVSETYLAISAAGTIRVGAGDVGGGACYFARWSTCVCRRRAC